MNDSLKALHDRMLEEKPESAQHDSDECPFCNPQIPTQHGGRMSDMTFTEDQVEALVQAKVAEATASLQAELDTFKSSQEAAAVEAKIAEAKAEADEKVRDLQAQLDASVIEASEAKKAYEDLTTYLDSLKTEAEAAAALEALTEERKAAVAEAVTFPEEYVEQNVARWAAMSAEDFEATLADYKAIAERAAASAKETSGSEEPGVPGATALGSGARETAGATGSGFTALSALREVRAAGVDPRDLTR